MPPSNALYDIALVIAAAAFITVAAYMGWRIVRDRGRGDAGESLGRQLLWWALPTILMLVLIGISFIRVSGG